jgi:fumarate hydratase subunit beta
MIGKGQRSDDVKKAMIKWGAVYFAAVGGTGALISRCIQTAEILAWEDLGTEAVRRLTIRDFPAIVAVDSSGDDLYLLGRNRYRK